MRAYVDGGCRWNGTPWACGAAAAVFIGPGKPIIKSKRLPNDPYLPARTSQRSEIEALILALEIASKTFENLGDSSRSNLEILGDFKYVIDAMLNYVWKSRQRDWLDACGEEVKNRDLFERAVKLDLQLSKMGEVTYGWVPREEDQEADQRCTEVLDEMEEEMEQTARDCGLSKDNRQIIVIGPYRLSIALREGVCSVVSGKNEVALTDLHLIYVSMSRFAQVARLDCIHIYHCFHSPFLHMQDQDYKASLAPFTIVVASRQATALIALATTLHF